MTARNGIGRGDSPAKVEGAWTTKGFSNSPSSNYDHTVSGYVVSDITCILTQVNIVVNKKVSIFSGCVRNCLTTTPLTIPTQLMSACQTNDWRARA